MANSIKRYCPHPHAVSLLGVLPFAVPPNTRACSNTEKCTQLPLTHLA